MRYLLLAAGLAIAAACTKSNNVIEPTNQVEVLSSTAPANDWQYSYMYMVKDDQQLTADLYAVRYNPALDIEDTVLLAGNQFNAVVRDIDSRLPDSTHTWRWYNTTSGRVYFQKDENQDTPPPF